jgi:hypothetical protein
MNDIPNFTIPPSQENVTFAAEVSERINAETRNIERTNRLLAAKSAMWRMLGFGVGTLSIGAAIGLGLFGYSFVTDTKTAEERLTRAFAEALQKNTLTVAGTVGIGPDATVALQPGGRVEMAPGQVALAPGATVAMRPGEVSGTVTGTVALAPGGTVSMTASPDMADLVKRWKTEQTNNPEQTSGPPSELNKVTRFSSIEMGSGQVVSGWEYHADDNWQKPVRQYCYYAESGGGMNKSFTIGQNGSPIGDYRLSPFPNVDMTQAFKNCSWHS